MEQRVSKYESIIAFRFVRSLRDAGILCGGISEPLVHSGLRFLLRAGVNLWLSPRGMAIWAGGGRLVTRRSTKMAWRQADRMRLPRVRP